jgi:phosphatidylglycerol---prolipoprotein diacylglyceryl transferase
MHPVLFRLGPLAIRSYGLMLFLGFICGIWLAVSRAKKSGVKVEAIIDLAIVILISSIVGSRFFYVIFHLEEFKGRFWDIINPIHPGGDISIAGLSMVGGVILAILSGLVYLYLKRLEVWKIADIVSPSFILGLAIARMGCFLNGCCFGKPTGSFLGVVFPLDSPAGYVFPDIHILPTQIFSSIGAVIVLLILLFLERYKNFEGFTFWLMVMLYSINRFIIDFFRYYEPSTTFKVLHTTFSSNQITLFFAFFVSLFMFVWFEKRAR